MKKRSQRGAARISAVWMIVAIVLMILTFAVGTAMKVFGQRLGVRHQ